MVNSYLHGYAETTSPLMGDENLLVAIIHSFVIIDTRREIDVIKVI